PDKPALGPDELPSTFLAATAVVEGGVESPVLGIDAVRQPERQHHLGELVACLACHCSEVHRNSFGQRQSRVVGRCASSRWRSIGSSSDPGGAVAVRWRSSDGSRRARHHRCRNRLLLSVWSGYYIG